ncbi:hypothetical protein [Streptomyces sp. NL15-2K]|uniref:hypothetical protein n=1 Tax=Streptomyces sp. NL15-2K TaxID=376149 RepID=UPI000F587BCE|nr:hypothetical protein [Streptomyces sp. NL15-2K]GCB44712.1 hypothetical protein SNL152K_2002 [Streptomyces sp. NL15-2K]
MTLDQLPSQVREFANYLDGLLARLDQGAGWCGVFWQRDPDGMQACLDGREVPPWDVVEALLQDLAAQYGPGGAGPEVERARALHAAALVAYDARPGGRDALGDRFDVMLREQRYAAERQAELGRLLASATTQEAADAIRLDLAWARDDHERATRRCAELRSRLAELDRRSTENQAQTIRRGQAGDGAVFRVGGEGGEAGRGEAGARGGGSYGAGSGGRDAYGGRPDARESYGGQAGVGGSRGVGSGGREGYGGRPDTRDAYGGQSGTRESHGVGSDGRESYGGQAGMGESRGLGSGGREGYGGRPDARDAYGGQSSTRESHGVGSEGREAYGGQSDARDLYDRLPNTRDTHGAGPRTHESYAEQTDTRESYGERAGGYGGHGGYGPSGARADTGTADPSYESEFPDIPQQRDARSAAEATARRERERARGWAADTHDTRAGMRDPGHENSARLSAPGTAADEGMTGLHGGPGAYGPAQATNPEQDPRFPAPAEQAPAPPQPAPTSKQRKRRRGSARFAGMVEEEAAPVVVPPTAVPDLPTAPAATRRTLRGARFAGADKSGARPEPQAEPLDTADRRETAETVERLVRLRGEGRSGEAHALLAEIAYWPAARYPLLAAEMQRAGLGADWATLLWEAASLPADRLVAAADALVEAGRGTDGEQILRQGVARPAVEIGQAVLALAADGRRREIRALLDAYVRVRTPEEAARSADPDPQTLVPLLVEAAQGVSDERHWDLVHALRVAGHPA